MSVSAWPRCVTNHGVSLPLPHEWLDAQTFSNGNTMYLQHTVIGDKNSYSVSGKNTCHTSDFIIYGRTFSNTLTPPSTETDGEKKLMNLTQDSKKMNLSLIPSRQNLVWTLVMDSGGNLITDMMAMGAVKLAGL